MTTYTPRLGLPFIEAAQAQKHVTHNAALEQLDVATQLSVQGIAAQTPPANPVEGQVWGLAGAPTGAWAGHSGDLATWAGGGWLFVTPQEGWRAWDLGQSTLYARDSGQWTALAGALAPAPQVDLNNLPGVGINAVADATNRLAVAADATLLTHAGGGHQLKLNKAAPGQTASLMYQTGFSGRAEMGLAGNDDFSVKVSADGTAWKQGLRVEAATGLTLAHGLMSQRIVLNDNAAATIVPPGNGGFLMIMITDANVALASHAAILAYDTGNTPALVSLARAANFNVAGDSVLTGTTGPTNSSSLSAQSGTLMLENRSGNQRSYSLTFIGGV